MKIKEYMLATRPHLAIFFVEVIIGALIALNFRIFSLDLIKLLIIFISFQLLYYGLYILNDIIDFKYDRLSPRKQHRPIASEKISRKNALIFSLILLSVALIISLNTFKTLFYFEIFFLSYVLIYSLLLKRIPYIDTFSGAVTHTARVVMGIFLFGAFNYWFLAIFLFLIFSSFLTIKRLKEIKNKEKVKRPIKYYSERKIKTFWLSVVLLSLILIYFSKSMERVIIITLLAVYILAISLYSQSPSVKKLFEKIAD